MKFEAIEEYYRDVKRLSKRYKTLNEDLEIVKKVLKVHPEERPPFSFRIDGLGITSCVIKVKKIACKSLKGKGANTGLRLIYAHFQNEGEEDKIVFVELYHKGDKALEDKKRILKHFD